MEGYRFWDHKRGVPAISAMARIWDGDTIVMGWAMKTSQHTVSSLCPLTTPSSCLHDSGGFGDPSLGRWHVDRFRGVHTTLPQNRLVSTTGKVPMPMIFCRYSIDSLPQHLAFGFDTVPSPSWRNLASEFVRGGGDTTYVTHGTQQLVRRAGRQCVCEPYVRFV